MAFEIPRDLIRELQSNLRRASGWSEEALSNDHAPSLPSISEAVATLEPSVPSHLRCHRCRGPLIRGIRSTACIYCGFDRRDIAAEQSISFTDTAACRNFLDALGLDGSEVVTLEPKTRKLFTGDDSPKAQSSPEKELILLDLLNLDIRWPSVKEEPVNVTMSQVPSQSTYALNLSGVELDTFFTSSKNEVASSTSALSNEQVKQMVHVETYTTSDNLHTSEMIVTSIESKGGEAGDSFADWEADFQSANSKPVTTDSKSVDLFQNSALLDSANLANSIDTVSDLQDDIIGSTNVITEASFEAKSQLSSVDGWFQDIQDHPSNKVASTSDQYKSIGVTGEVEVKNVTSKVEVNNGLFATTKTDSWQDDLWSENVTKEFEDGKSLQDDGSFDAWQEFTSSAPVQQTLVNPVKNSDFEMVKNNEPLEQEPVDLQDVDFGYFFQSDAVGAPVNNTSSTEGANLDFAMVKNNEPLKQEPVDLQDVDFGDFFQSDAVGAPVNNTSSTEGANLGLDTSHSNRMNKLHAEVDATNATPKTPRTDGNITSDSNLQNDEAVVEMLLSEMPDLSFMLKDELSIPTPKDAS